MSFVHRHNADAVPSPADFVIAVQDGRVLIGADTTGAVHFPEVAAIAERLGPSRPLLHVGLLDERPCWLCSVEDAGAAAPAGCVWKETRTVLASLAPARLAALGCARALHWWRGRHRFCGSCGAPTVEDREERAMRCPKCGASFFPSAFPAAIVAVTRGERLLLAHNRNFRPGMFSLLAGFVEPGETVEEAAARELREEVGIEIGELRYVSSQPWPFPNSLMLAFRAKHLSGEIVVDGREIEQAGWFARDALPDLPFPGTVARAIIDAWLREPGPGAS